MAVYLGLDTTAIGRAVSSAFVTATNGSGTITLTGREGYRHHAVGIYWSYSGNPSGGGLFTSGLEGDELAMDIIVGGPGPMVTPPAVGARGSDLAITLAAGGPGIVGKLTIFYLTLPG